MALNLEKQLRFYGAYHRDPVNVGIHEVFVPTIMATFLLVAGAAGDVLPIPQQYTPKYLEPNPGTLCAIAWMVFYILLEPVAGVLIAPGLLGMAALGNYFRLTYGMTAIYFAIGIHTISWIAQFVGHGVYEGRKPALLNSLFQSLVLAGLFVWLEVLFSLGYRPELQKRLAKLIEEDRAKLDLAEGKTPRPVTRSQTGKKTNGHA